MRILRVQVTKNILYEKVGGIYDFKAIEVKKARNQGSNNKGKCNNPIFWTQIKSTCDILQIVLNIGLLLIIRPLFTCFFTPLLPSNPIYYQLSHRECF